MKYFYQFASFILLLIFTMQLTPMSVEAANSINVIGGIGGEIRSVKIVGNYVYVAEGSCLTILDISDRDHPIVSARLALNFGDFITLDVAGNTVFCLTDGGLSIVGVSQPTTPSIMGQMPLAQGYGLTAVSSKKVIVGSISNLQMIDASNPSAPNVLCSVNGWFDCVKASGNLLVAKKIGDALPDCIFDISNPATLTLKSKNDMSLSLGEMEFSGPLLYIAAYNLEIMDLNDPTSPTTKSILHFPTGLAAVGVAVSGTTAVVTMGDGHLAVLDVANPTQPKILSILTGPYNALYSAMGNNLACLVDDPDRIQIGKGCSLIDLSKPATPVMRGHYNAPFPYRDARPLAISGKKVYVVDNSIGTDSYQFSDSYFNVLDISKPASISLSGRSKIIAYIANMTTTGSLAVLRVTNPYDGLAIYNVSDPTSPTMIGKAVAANKQLAYDSHYPAKAALIGHFALLADNQQLYTFDISNPKNPILKNSFPVPSKGYNVAIFGSIGLISGSRLSVIDLSNPLSPKLISSPVIDAADFTGIAGSYLHAISSTGDFEVISLADPMQPRIISTIPLSCPYIVGKDTSSATSFALSAKPAKIGWEPFFTVIDTVFPDRPVIREARSIPFLSMAVCGSQAFCGASLGELFLIQFTGNLYSHSSPAWLDLP